MQYRVFQTRHKETDRTFYVFENSLALPHGHYIALGNESVLSDWKWAVLSMMQRREFNIFWTVHLRVILVETNLAHNFSIICLFESSICFEQLCALPQEENCMNTTSGIITLC